MKLVKTKFSDLKVGDEFRSHNKTFHKTLEVDMGSVIYNAITDWIDDPPWQQQFIQLVPDDRFVMAIQKEN